MIITPKCGERLPHSQSGIDSGIFNGSFPARQHSLDTLTSMKVFREVVDSGSFVAAAARLGLSAPMASKHVAHLERHLGARLLNRTSRRLSMTEAGSVYFEHCREALDTLEMGEGALGQNVQSPRGILKITAPVWCATARFAHMLAAYRLKYPGVVVDMRLENRKIDLAAEGYDLALRATREPSPALIVRPVCEVRFLLVATPSYLQRHGRPKSPRELAQHAAILPPYVTMES